MMWVAGHQPQEAAVRIEEVVGTRIRSVREHEGMSQEQLGRELGRYLGKPWPNQQVSVAEDGGRKFSALEIFALCMVLKRPASYFFTPNPDDVVEVPGSVQRVGDEAFDVQWARRDDAAAVLPQMKAVFAPLLDLLETAQGATKTAHGLIENIAGALYGDDLNVGGAAPPPASTATGDEVRPVFERDVEDEEVKS
jgi:transcriptional regulator with XRE-family HTH domain